MQSRWAYKDDHNLQKVYSEIIHCSIFGKPNFWNGVSFIIPMLLKDVNILLLNNFQRFWIIFSISFVLFFIGLFSYHRRCAIHPDPTLSTSTASWADPKYNRLSHLIWQWWMQCLSCCILIAFSCEFPNIFHRETLEILLSLLNSLNDSL